MVDSYDATTSRFAGVSAENNGGPLAGARAATSEQRPGHDGRAGRGLTERCVVQSYDAPSGTATVQMLGALSRVIGPIAVSNGLPTAGIVGRAGLVVLLDVHNPADAVLVATW